MVSLKQVMAAAAITVVAAGVATPALARGEADDVFTPEERQAREALQKQLAALPTAGQLARNPLLAGTLDAVLPGAGTFYGTGNGNTSFSTATGMIGVDVASYYLVGAFTTPSLSNPWFVGPVAATVGMTHLIGGLYGGILTHQANQARPDVAAEGEKKLRDEIAAIDAGALKRARDRGAVVEQALDTARGYAARGLHDLALRALEHPQLRDDLRVPQLRAELEEARTTAKAAFAERKARDDAFRLKKGRELLDRLMADAAVHASQRDWEHAIALLAEVPKDVPADWRQQVNDLVTKYAADEERAGGREKLRPERELRLARLHRQRADGVERALYQCVLAGNRQGALQKLTEYDTAGESGSVSGRALLFASAATKLKQGTVRPGEAMVLQCQVESITSGGMVVVVKNAVGGLVNYIARGYGVQPDETPIRVFVKTRGIPGVVDGDGLVLGVRAAGTFSYTTIAGARATIRAVDLGVRLD